MDSEHSTSIRCRLPGDLNGKKPKVHGKGRRCRCGAVLNQYTPGEWCNLCDQNPGRRDRYAELDIPEKMMDGPEKMTAKQAAEHLDVHVRDLRDLAAAGHFAVLKAGRGWWSSTYVADSVRAYKLRRDAHLDATPLEESSPTPHPDGIFTETVPADKSEAIQDAVDNDPECCGNPIGCDRDCGETLVRPLSDGDDRCYSKDEKCCGTPEQCELGPEVAETRDATIHRLLGEFSEHLQGHLTAVGGLRSSATEYLVHFQAAQDFGRRASRVQEHLRSFGVEVAPQPYGQPNLLVEPDVKDDSPVDPEIRAMYQVRDALVGLDRDAQLRVVRWALSRFGLDAPPAVE